MRNQPKKKLKKVNKNFSSQKIIKEPLELLKKINLKSLEKLLQIL